MSAEREAEEKARRQILARVGSWTERDTQRGETVGLLTLYAALDAYAATIAARVRAENDAEWRARVEGARRYMAIKQGVNKQGQPLVEMRYHDPKRHKAEPKCIWLPELLTAVARDREGDPRTCAHRGTYQICTCITPTPGAARAE